VRAFFAPRSPVHYFMASNTVYIGVKAHVVAVDKNDGRTLWQTKLKGGAVSGDRFVSLLVAEGRVYARSYGELFCLDSGTGQILWKNALDGLGYDIASIAIDSGSTSFASSSEYRREKKSAQAGAAASSGH
jgi:outer membrane protein assembly factor BamB